MHSFTRQGPTQVLAIMLALGLASGRPTQRQGAADSKSPQLQALAEKAQRALQDQKLPEAQSAYEEILKLDPHLAEAHANLGVVLQMQGRHEDAIPHLTQALALNPKLHSAEIVLALCYFSMDQFRRAIPLFEKAYHRSGTDPVVVRHLGLAYFKVGDDEQALRLFTRWVELEPRNPDALYYKGQASMELSLDTFRKLKEVAPDSARVHELEAQVLRQQGRSEQAIAEFKKAISIAPDTAELYDALGSIYLENGRLDEARAQFEQGLQLSPNDPLTNYLLGDVLLQQRNLPQAEKYLLKAIQLHGSLLEAQMDIAKLYRLRGDDEKAIHELDEITQLAPDRYEPHYILYEIYRKAGNAARAQTELQVFQTLKQKKDADSAHPESVLPPR